MLSIKFTHHYLRLAAVSLTVVVRGDHHKLKIRPPHVAVHDGRLHHAAVRVDDEAVLAVFGAFASRGLNDQTVQHSAVVTRVFVQGLGNDENEMASLLLSSRRRYKYPFYCAVYV